MKKETVCFIDMDGVLSDFCLQTELMIGKNVRGLKNKSNLSNEERIAQYQAEHLADFSEMFWRHMPLMKDADKLIDYCLQKYDTVKLLSKYVPPIGIPHRLLYVRQAKMRWAMEHFGDKIELDNIIVTKYNKTQHMEENKTNILIDDTYNEVKKWRERGGIGFLYKDYGQFMRLMTLNKQYERDR